MDGPITDADNPAAKVAKPRRLASTRRALPDEQLAAVIRIATTTGKTLTSRDSRSDYGSERVDPFRSPRSCVSRAVNWGNADRGHFCVPAFGGVSYFLGQWCSSGE